MRLVAIVSLIALLPSDTASQSADAQRSVMLSQSRTGGMNVMVELRRDVYYLSDPVSSVPAEPSAPGATLTAAAFSLRAWKEGDGARVVVSAVVADPRAPARQVETPMTTFSLSHADGTRRVTETEQWGAAPVVVRLVGRVRR